MNGYPTPGRIVRDYYKNLLHGTERLENFKIKLLFFFFPFAVSVVALFLLDRLGGDVVTLGVSSLSILCALLFAAQFSLFSVVSSVEPEKIAHVFSNRSDFKRVLRYINSAISYLIFFAVVSLVGVLVLVALSLPAPIEIFLFFYAVAHFFVVFIFLLPSAYDILDFAYSKF